jgi:YHS domain-containing protein
MCPVKTTELATKDTNHAVRLNYEWFFCSSEDAVAAFNKDPIRYCGTLTDPVSRQRFVPGDDSPRVDHEGVSYYFWTDSTRITFQMMPDMYAQPNLKMLPKDSTEVSEGPDAG